MSDTREWNEYFRKLGPVWGSATPHQTGPGDWLSLSQSAYEAVPVTGLTGEIATRGDREGAAPLPTEAF